MKLRNCPFCGGEARLEEFSWSTGDVSYIIRCSKCLTQRGVKRLPKQEAIEAWNHRVDDDLMERMENDGK